MPLTANVAATVVAAFTGTTVPGLTVPTAAINKEYRTILSNGVAAGQGDKLWVAQRTIAASSNDDLDLNGGAVDAFGTAMAFIKLKAIIVSAAAGNTNNVIIGGGASNPVTSFMSGTTPATIVRPGATFALIVGQADLAAYGVTAGTADILRLTNGGAGTSVIADVILIGTSA